MLKSFISTMALGFAAIAVVPVGSAELYGERWRPQFHFTPAKNWMNDPNGMVFYDGEYHLFYQYNPFGDKWGHMSWGHAVSRDMVHWQHLPVALFEENDVMIFSGSAVVDWKNTSGLGRDGKPPLVAIYTGHYTKKPLQNQQIAYSNDRGRTWKKYEGNPVLDIGERDFRDPKVMWHEPSKRWIMTVAWPVQRKVRFYSSPNLKEWQHLSDFGPAGSVSGIWECPDLFPLPVEGARREEKWVLIVNVGSGAPAGGSGCQYFFGEFDGTTFTLDKSYPKAKPEIVPEGQLLADFEGKNYGDWRATGDAFGEGPARGTLPNQQDVSGFRGQGLVNTYRKGDSSQGTLTSPDFEITHDYLNFLMGGGHHPGKTGMNLIVDGRVVRSETGSDSERLSWRAWNVRELRGKRARLEILDRHSGGWGHINVDDIQLANSPARPAVDPALWAEYGPDFYAAVSWSDIPKRDGRRLWIGWMSNWQYANDVPTSPWRSAMSLPRELVLRRTAEGLRLVQKPVRELRALREEKYTLKKAGLQEANEWLREKKIEGAMWELEAEIDLQESGEDFGFRVLQGPGQGTTIQCNPKEGILSVDRTHSGETDFHPSFEGKYEAPLPASKRRLRLHLFLDTSSVEVFASDGEVVMTSLVLPKSEGPVQLWALDNRLQIREMQVWKLRPAVPILRTDQ